MGNCGSKGGASSAGSHSQNEKAACFFLNASDKDDESGWAEQKKVDDSGCQDEPKKVDSKGQPGEEGTLAGRQLPNPMAMRGQGGDNDDTQAQNDTEFVEEAADVAPPDSNVLEAIGNVVGAEGNHNLINHILSFLLHPIPKKDYRSYWYKGFVPRVSYTNLKEVQKSVGTCLRVCKVWNKVTWEIMSPSIPGIISSSQLAVIKKHALSLDLEFLEEHFRRELEKTIQAQPTTRSNKFLKENLRDYIATTISIKGLTRAYQEFLIIKAIEYYAERVTAVEKASTACNYNDRKVLDIWKEKCQPSWVIDMLWHAHLLSPRKYQEHCKLLVGPGKVIDHQVGYCSPNQVPGSDYNSKVDLVMDFEKKVFRSRRWQSYDFLSKQNDMEDVVKKCITRMNTTADCG